MMRRTLIACSMALAAAGALAQPSGAEIYASKCAACHQALGAGAPGLAPPLAGNAGRFAASPAGRDHLPRVLLTGMAGSIVVGGERYVGAMPSQAALSDQEIVAVLSYVLKDIEKVDNLGWLTAEHVANIRRAGGTPNETFKQRPGLQPAGK